MNIKIYQDRNGKEPFTDWLESVKSTTVRLRIRKRLRRIELGNFGDFRLVADGIFELRLHFGPGYRVYYGKIGNEIILLLAGGDKSTQQRDIKKVKQYWYDYKQEQQN